MARKATNDPNTFFSYYLPGSVERRYSIIIRPYLLPLAVVARFTKQNSLLWHGICEASCANFAVARSDITFFWDGVLNDCLCTYSRI